MEGFANLRTARDLLKKLTHDFELLREKPTDSYRAFNFFCHRRTHPGLAVSRWSRLRRRGGTGSPERKQ